MTTDTLALDLAPPPGGQILHQSDRAAVIWGDCRDPTVISQVPAGYGLLCTDPPYGVNYRSEYSRNFTALVGDQGDTDWPATLAEWVGPEGTDYRGKNARGLGENRHLYVFGYQPEDLKIPMRLSGTAELIWDKTKTGMGDLSQPWGPAHERICFGVHTKSRVGREKFGKGRLPARLRQGSVIRVPRPNATGVNRHPTEKPTELMAQLIESSTHRGDLVVDPCAGSGSTGVAAILTGRRCFLVEYDRGYAELCVERVKAAEKIAKLIEAA